MPRTGERRIRPAVLGFVIATPLAFVLWSLACTMQYKWGFLPDPLGRLPLLLPPWAWDIAIWVSMAAPLAAVWVIVSFAISAILRLRPFPDCFFIGLIASALLCVPTVAELAADREPWPLFLKWVIVLCLVFPLISSVSSLAGAKIAGRLRRARTPTHTPAHDVSE
jgi:hypothetical protein